jgi:hypothetical protein
VANSKALYTRTTSGIISQANSDAKIKSVAVLPNLARRHQPSHLARGPSWMYRWLVWLNVLSEFSGCRYDNETLNVCCCYVWTYGQVVQKHSAVACDRIEVMCDKHGTTTCGRIEVICG